MRYSIKMALVITIFFAAGLHTWTLVSAAELDSAQQTRTDARVGMTFMSVGLVTGACGAIEGFVNYAQITGNKYALEFIQKYIESESRRLTISVQDYVNNCKSKKADYQRYSRMLNEMLRTGGIINVK